MKKLIFITLLAVILSQTTIAQKFYTSRNYDKAIKEQTRSTRGVPGDNYWQNTSSYNIYAKVFPKESRLEAFQTITYTNNSPDSLRYVVFNIFQNLYKKGLARMSSVSPEDLHDGVVVEKLMVNNGPVESKMIRYNGTLMYVYLKNKLAPGATAEFKMDWSFHIPEKSNIRMGKYSDESVFIGNWFPKINVYDDIEKWDKHSHNGLAEFYNDFSTYEVAIEVPENYIIQATGELQNAESVLQTQIIKRLEKAKVSDKNVTIVSPGDRIVTKKGKQTWRFKASNVPDFAFGIAKNYIWEGSSTQPKGMNRRVFVDAIYNPVNAEHFAEVVDIAKQTINYMSEEMPAIPYPFSHMTVYEGDGGMEYPMIVNDGVDKKRSGTVYVTSHEIFHSIFPMYVGISETRYGWFDEGFTVLFPEELQQRIEPEVKQAARTIYYQEKYYLSSEQEPVLMTPTYYLDGKYYFSLSYAKSEIALRLFSEYLGKNVFKNVMNSFIKTWANKHPTPYDFFHFVNDYTQTNYSWYWSKWFFEYGKTDLALKNIEKTNSSYSIVVENIGGLPLPISLNVTFTDGTTEELNYKMDVWKAGQQSVEIQHIFEKDVKSVTLGNKLIPDMDKSNNEIIL